MSLFRLVEYARPTRPFLHASALLATLTLQACGGGSGGTGLEEEATPSLGSAKSVPSSPLILTSAASYSMQFRAVAGDATGEWSDDITFTFSQDDDPGDMLTTEEIVKNLVRSTNRLEWAGDPAATGYEVRAVSAVDGTVVAEVQYPATDICQEGLCRLEPMQLPSDSVGEKPVAVISQTTIEGPSPLPVVIDATQSSDAESERLNYRWHVHGQFVDNNQGKVFSRTFRRVGEHRIVLEVTDEAGNRSRDYALVVVTEPDPDSDIPEEVRILESAEEERANALKAGAPPTVLSTPAVFVTVAETSIDTSDSGKQENTLTSVSTGNAAVVSGAGLPKPGSGDSKPNTPSSSASSQSGSVTKPVTQTGDQKPSTNQTASTSNEKNPVKEPSAQVSAEKNSSSGSGQSASSNSNPFGVVEPAAPAKPDVDKASSSGEQVAQVKPTQVKPSSESGTQTSNNKTGDSESTDAGDSSSSTSTVDNSSSNSGSDANTSSKEPAQVQAPPAPAAAADTKPPIISQVSDIDVRTNRVSVKWHLDEYAKGFVNFGETPDFGRRTKGEESFNYNVHIQQVKDLEPSTRYYFQIVVEDAAGNQAVSETYEFTTAEVVAQNTTSAPPPANYNSVSDGWPAGANGELPLAGIFYGNPFAGIGTANATIALESSRRFRAERTGQIEYVRYHNRILRDYEITARCGNNGSSNKYCKCVNAGLDAVQCGYTMNSYSVGNGGTIVVEMRPDDGNGTPSDVVLGKTYPFVPVENADKWYPALEFETIPTIEAGGIYHLVYTNLTPPSTCPVANVPVSQASACPRNEGAMSLNGNFHLTDPENTGRFGPYRGDKSAATMWRRDINGSWNMYHRTLSYYELGYTDGVAVGDSYYGHLAAAQGTQTIGGSTRGRQYFTVRDVSRNVTGLWLNFTHRPNADGSSLNVKLKTMGGSTLASGSIASSAKCRSAVNKSSNYAEETCREWGYLPFNNTVSLIEGDKYYVELTAGSNAKFGVSTYQPFTSHGFTDRNHWFDAYAQVSHNNGSSWEGWGHGWENERDMPLVFTIEGMPIQLP